MTSLDKIFANVTAEVIEPIGLDSHYLPSLRLLLRDNATGALTELTIEADMLTLPDAPVLVWSAMEVDEQVEDRAAWWGKGDVASEAQQHVIVTLETCPCDKRSDVDCNVCDGGLAICSICNKAEIELDEPCVVATASELEPPPTWTITPDGQEVDLRGGHDGLF